MKTISVIAAAALSATVATTALANSVVYTDGPGDIQGGIFHAVTATQGSFDTFCIEFTEHLNTTGTVTYSYDVNDYATFNGQGGGFRDPLDSRTAFIYTQFRHGEIRNILGDQGLSDTDMSNAIQIAMWAIEDEPVDFSFHSQFANAQLLIAAAENAIANGTWSGLGNVRVMNVWVQGQEGTTQGARQDTLIMLPLPSGAGLASVGLLGLGFVSRKRRR